MFSGDSLTTNENTFRAYHDAESENIGRGVHWAFRVSFWAAPHPVAQLSAHDRTARRHDRGIFNISQLNTLDISVISVNKNVVCFDI